MIKQLTNQEILDQLNWLKPFNGWALDNLNRAYGKYRVQAFIKNGYLVQIKDGWFVSDEGKRWASEKQAVLPLVEESAPAPFKLEFTPCDLPAAPPPPPAIGFLEGFGLAELPPQPVKKTPFPAKTPKNQLSLPTATP